MEYDEEELEPPQMCQHIQEDFYCDYECARCGHECRFHGDFDCVETDCFCEEFVNED